MLDEYEDDELGELDPDADDVQGHVEDEDATFGMYMDQHLRKTQQRVLPELSAPEVALRQASIVAAMAREDDEDDDPDAVDARIDELKAAKKEVEWDCQSILSTRSNKDNIPRVISVARLNPSKIIKLGKVMGVRMPVAKPAQPPAATTSVAQGATAPAEKPAPAPANAAAETKPGESGSEDDSEMEVRSIVSSFPFFWGGGGALILLLSLFLFLSLS